MCKNALRRLLECRKPGHKDDIQVNWTGVYIRFIYAQSIKRTHNVDIMGVTPHVPFPKHTENGSEAH